MNDQYDSEEKYSNQYFNREFNLNPQDHMNSLKENHLNDLKSPERTQNYLPSSLLKDLNTTEEEESDEEQDIVDPNDLDDIDSLQVKNLCLGKSQWENQGSCIRKLKPPSKKSKEKFYSFDDIQQQKQFQFQKMKQNQMMIQYQAQQQLQQQQQKMYYANQIQPSSINNWDFYSPQGYYQPQVPQFIMNQPIYNGNYSMNPYVCMNQSLSLRNIPADAKMLYNSKKSQMNLGEKILSNPKRILSSPGACLQVTAKKKKDKKKSSTKVDFNSLEELLKSTGGNIFSFIITQKGSRDVQKLLYKISPSDLLALVDNLSEHFSDLMVDKYANYFCQKLIQNCSPELRIQILKSIQSKFIEISCNSFGTHSLQTLIEIANIPSEQEVLCQCIETDVLSLALDPKGTHVLQKFISCSQDNKQGNIAKILLDSFDSLINNSHGVCVLIKFVNNTTDQLLKEKLISLISNNALEIIQNPFGNYVVQSLLKEATVEQCKVVLQVICDNFFSLSMQKFSSNVVESSISLIDEETLRRLSDEVISNGKLNSMLKNTYGNFVIEKIIGKLSKEDKVKWRQELQSLGKEKGISPSIISLLS